MTSHNYKNSLLALAAIPNGRVGICAKSIDGRQLLEINADEVFPAASSIRLCVLFALPAKAENTNKDTLIQPEDIVRTVLFVLSMAETACPTEITILPQRSPYV